MTTRSDRVRSPATDWLPSPRLAPGERRSARGRILATASDLFYREGVRSVGVDRIIAEAGVAKATFYRHFPSKDNLVGSWLALPHVRFLEWIGPEAGRRASSPEDAVVEFFVVLGEWFENNTFRGCPFVNSAAEFSDVDHPAQLALADHQSAIVGWFEEELRAAGKSEPRLLAQQLLIVVAGAMVCASADPSRRRRNDGVAAAETLLRSAS